MYLGRSGASAPDLFFIDIHSNIVEIYDVYKFIKKV